MNVLVISLCSERLSEREFVDPIVRILEENGHSAQVKRSLSPDIGSLRGIDAIILSGTALADFGYLDHLDALQWVKDSPLPILGICAGMQVLALVHGGMLADVEEIGMVTVTPEVTNPLLTQTEQVYTLHTKDVGPPEDFEVLARSGRCIHAMRHRERPHYGVLFHPEVRNPGLIERFLSIF